MKSLRIQLKALSRECGDLGEQEEIDLVIDYLVDQVEQLFTPLALEAVPPVRFRHLHHWAVAMHNAHGCLPTARQFMSRVQFMQSTDPGLPLEKQLPQGENVFRLH